MGSGSRGSKVFIFGRFPHSVFKYSGPDWGEPWELKMNKKKLLHTSRKLSELGFRFGGARDQRGASNPE